MIRQELEKILTEVVGVKINLEYPASIDHGDYSSNVALANAKNESKNPREYAQEIVEKLKNSEELNRFISKVEVAGPGFINFWLSDDCLKESLSSEIRAQVDKKEKIMLEFAHPNTHKSFHIGHLLNIINGESLSRIWQEVGHQVIRANYQGDVGMHIAKALYGLMNMEYSDPIEPSKRAELLSKAYVSGNKAYEEDETAKSKIIEINKSIYRKDNEDINKLYNETRSWSLEYFKSIYDRLGTKFDRLYFEGEVFEVGLEKINEALNAGILEESEGAVVYKGEKDGLHTRVFLTNEGNPTYEGKDLGLAQFQYKEYQPDKIVHLVGKEQASYFKVLIRVIEQVYPELKDREIHQTYGWVSLKGGKMSSRKGNVVLGMWLLDEVKQKIINSYPDMNPDTAEIVSQAAVKYAFLKSSLEQDIAFDLEESININGNSGPYLQYSVVRAKSVIAKSDKTISKIDTTTMDKFIEGELVLVRKLSRIDGIIIDASNNYSPSTLATYLYDLASEFSSFYNGNKIIGDVREETRIFITNKFVNVMTKGLELLGIQVPDKM